jgi:heme/copper-type cytochrome/quinol oxidase subunit 4
MSEKKEKKAAGCLSEFIFFLLAVAVGLISIALVVYGAISGNQGLEILGIGLSAVFALLVFIIPYFRRNGYIRWLAWLALGDAAWWTYTMFAG